MATRGVWVMPTLALLVAACGGQAASTAPSPARTPATPSTPAESTVPTVAPPSAAASLAAGTIGYRVVNEGTAPVDVYVRSQGEVHTALAAGALAAGAVSDEVFPPAPGEVVVLPAGGGDPTCVSGCAFVAQASTNSGEGNHRILVARGDTSVELWADPTPASVGKVANALRPSDPAMAMAIVEAGGVTDGKFGLNVAWSGAKGCATALDASGLMLGGTNILAYQAARTGGSLSVFTGGNQTCLDPSIGGPVRIPAGASGSRSLVLLWGASGSMSSAVVPLP